MVSVETDKSLQLQLYVLVHGRVVLIFISRPNGIIFDVERDSVSPDISPKQGEVVSLSYENISRREKPTNPYVQRIRYDISWEAAIRSFEETTRQAQGLSGMRMIERLQLS